MSVNVDGGWSSELRRAIDDIETWIEVLHEAGHVHDGLAPTVANYIDGCADPNEILRMVPHLAVLSSSTRLSIERTLHAVLTGLRTAMQGGTDAVAAAPEDLPRLRSVH